MAPVPIDENRITYFAETDARNKRVRFGIKAKDRTKHVYVIGKTGMGKSTMLENMAVQDIQNGEGMCFIDPHGKTADLMLEYVPKERIKDVIYIAPFDVDYPISFNVLESVDQTKRHLVVSGLMSTFKKIWVDAWSARMEYILTNTLLALLEAPGTTLLGVNRMLSDKEYRKEIISHIQDPSVKAFWTKEFASYTERQAAEAVPAIQNKVGQFTANPLIRNMIGQPVSSFDFREAMDSRKIIIINLSKGRIGDENMKLLGGLLVTKIYLAAMSRADVSDRVMQMLPNFYLFVDEFQNFANASFADILSEARKYKLNLTIAHQYIEQMDEMVRPAVFGNVGTMIAFRVGATDAEALEQEFAPAFTIEDLVNLGFAQIYLKLMIDGLSSSPFSAKTLPPIPHPDTSYMNEIIASSREQFSRPRAEVEAQVIKFHEPIVIPKKVAAPAPASVATNVQKSATPAPAPVLANVPKSAQPPAPKPVSNSTPSSSIKNSPVDAKPSNSSAQQADNVSMAPAKRSDHSVPVAPRPAQTSAQPIKPVSLSSLASKPISPKNDPKVPTQKNLGDLKSALAAALQKSQSNFGVARNFSQPKSEIGVQEKSPTTTQADSPKASLAQNIPGRQNNDDFQPLNSLKNLKVIPKIPKVVEDDQKGNFSRPPKEVPEEVLKRVLKDD
ncbi:MAG: type IV secretion system DNA-binding domain-containing protein [Patescibacteria group bacterium]